MRCKFPVIEFVSADDAGKRIRVEPALGHIAGGALVQDHPAKQFFKRITASDGETSIEILLDFAAVQALCGHLTAVVELARGSGFGPDNS